MQCKQRTVGRLENIDGGARARIDLEQPERVVIDDEIEAVEAAGDAHLAVRRLFDGHAPVAAPAEGAEPDGAVLFAGVAGIDGEPRK